MGKRDKLNAEMRKGADAFSAQAALQKKRLSEERVNCPTCGGPLALPEHASTSVRCAYCGTSHDPETLGHGVIFQEEPIAQSGAPSHPLQCNRCGRLGIVWEPPGVYWTPENAVVTCRLCGQAQPIAEYNQALAGAYAAFEAQLKRDRETLERLFAKGAPCDSCGAINPVTYRDVARGFPCAYCGTITPLTNLVSPRTVAHYSLATKRRHLAVIWAAVGVLLCLGVLALVGWMVGVS